MEKVYDPKKIEEKIQEFWKKNKIFLFKKGEGNIFSIDTPPRYASGPLHIGHATSYMHQDFIARYKKMKGFNVFYPLCFDVNGLPIEVNVEKLGITPEKVGREKFLKECENFAKKNIETMTKQFEKLGFSMDSSIYYQTDAKYFRKLTQISFIRLYKEGLIYKGEAPVNWCPRCSTAIADAEIDYVERKTKMNYIRFSMDGSHITIATTRPELLPACVLIGVNPNDARYKHLIGKRAKTPIFSKEIEIIAEETVQSDFGTGIVMYCTFGDLEDLNIARKYKTPFIKAIDEKGRMTEIAGRYASLSTKEAREKIIEELKKEGLLEKQEEIQQNVGTCWRCNTPIEFIISREWFLKIIPYKKKILEASKKIKWSPEYMEERLKNWVDTLSWDWCISRDRYLATPVPVWECQDCGEIIVAEEKQCYVNPLKDKPPKKCKCGKLQGSKKVFDTWMDSSITVLYNSFWEREEKMFNKMFPMTIRTQAHDIIRTWAFYTILRSILLTNKEPFREIAISGYIMGPDGKPMHASRGNVVDPMDVLKKYNADCFRYFASTCGLGVDTAFKWKEIEHGKRLLTKLWNIAKFSGLHLKNYKPKKVKLRVIDKWILNQLAKVIKDSIEYYDSYNFSAAVSKAEDFLWHKLADNYIEIVKKRLYEEKDEAAKYTLYNSLLNSLKILSPIMPHIAEEIWQNSFKDLGKSIFLSDWPKPEREWFDKEAEETGDIMVAVISSIRQYKSKNGLPLNIEMKKLVIECEETIRKKLEDSLEDIKKATNAKELAFGKATIPVEGYKIKISIEN